MGCSGALRRSHRIEGRLEVGCGRGVSAHEVAKVLARQRELGRSQRARCDVAAVEAERDPEAKLSTRHFYIVENPTFALGVNMARFRRLRIS